jgi:hypothetical protein
MWLLHLLPDSILFFVVNGLLILGLVSTFIFFVIPNKIFLAVPVLSNYYRVFQIVSVAILAAGLYFKGGYSTEMQWRQKVAELEIKLKEAELKSKEVNVVIQEKVVTQTRVIKEKGKEIVTYVDRPVIVEYEKQCPLPKEVIEIHNEAADINLIVEQRNKEMKK